MAALEYMELSNSAGRKQNAMAMLATPTQPTAAQAIPLQGGMDNDELREAWDRKLPGVQPTDRELTAFALGVEVGDEGRRTYFMERNSARDAWRSRVRRCEELEAVLRDLLAYHDELGAKPADQRLLDMAYAALAGGMGPEAALRAQPEQPTAAQTQERAPTKIEPGSEVHLTLLMAPHGLNLVVGEDRKALLAYARDVWAAALRAHPQAAAHGWRPDSPNLWRLGSTPQAAQAVPQEWREFVEKIAKQKPEKPDYWSSCGQCERNANEADDLLSAPTTQAAGEQSEGGKALAYERAQAAGEEPSDEQEESGA